MNFRVRDTWNFNFSPWIKDDRYDFPVCKGGVNTYWNAQQMAAVSEYTVHLPDGGMCSLEQHQGLLTKRNPGNGKETDQDLLL